MTPDQFADAIRKAGLQAHAAAIFANARPAIGLALATEGSEQFNRFGGSPEMPTRLEWPEYEGRPLPFLAQFQLSTLRGFAAATLLPPEGRLWFFCDFDHPFTVQPGAWRVLFTRDEAESIAPRTDPAPFNPKLRIAATPLAGFEAITLPGARSIELQALSFVEDPECWERYLELLSMLDEQFNPACHWMLGHPGPIQGCMQRIAQFESHGAGKLPSGIYSYYEHPRAAELMPGAHDWQLLLQVESDERICRTYFGDMGRLYFWIRKQDLAACQFDQVWFFLQC